MTDLAAPASGITHRYINAGGLRMHIAEAGEGPLVVLLHGFPESWYSWRHQLARSRRPAITQWRRISAATA